MAKQGRTLARLTLGAVCVLLLACDRSPTSPAGGSVHFETVLKTTLLGNAPQHLQDQLPIRDRATWQAVWAELHRQSGSQPPLPEIVFGREIVVLALGPGCCGGVEISSIELQRDELVVSALAEGSTNTVCVAGDFSVHVVRLRRVEASVRLVVRRQEKLC
jgi:hypothetical protein